jgi:hypothetical protein
MRVGLPQNENGGPEAAVSFNHADVKPPAR